MIGVETEGGVLWQNMTPDQRKVVKLWYWRAMVKEEYEYHYFFNEDGTVNHAC